MCDKVFVGGVPGYFKEPDLRKVLAPYVSVRSIKLPLKLDDSSLNKGYCIVTLKSTEDAQKLVEVSQIYVGNGRYVFCRPFLHGQQLHYEMVRNDQRRIILKQLSPELTEQKLRDYFETHYGKVELVFVYQPDEASDRPSEARKSCTASVTFCRVQDAYLVFRHPEETSTTLIIHGRQVIAERFKSQQAIVAEENQNAYGQIQMANNQQLNYYEEYHKNDGSEVHLAPTSLKGKQQKLRSSKLRKRIMLEQIYGNRPNIQANLDHSHQNVRFNIQSEDSEYCINRSGNNKFHNTIKQPSTEESSDMIDLSGKRSRTSGDDERGSSKTSEKLESKTARNIRC